MTPDQIRRHGARRAARDRTGTQRAGPARASVDREPDEVQDRYDRLHAWRKNKAKMRGVESDVILPRTALWISRAARRARTASWRASPTWVRGGGRRTGTRFWRWSVQAGRTGAIDTSGSTYAFN